MSARYKVSRRNIYIILIILCIVFTILIESTFISFFPSESKISFTLDKEKFKAKPFSLFLLFVLSILYLSIFVIGIVNLIIFAIRKYKNKPLLYLHEKVRAFLLSEEEAVKLLFLITFFVLIVHGITALLYILKWRVVIETLILLNMMLQIGVIFIIFKYLTTEYLGFYFDRRHTLAALQVYTATIPFILGSLILNSFLAKKLGLAPTSNPAIELLFFLKTKMSIFILSLQIVILGPLAEELFFRGFIYKMMRTRYNFLVSATIASLLFAFLHRVPYDILPLFIIGIALSYLYEKSQNIYTPFIFHSIFNLVSLSLFLTVKNFFVN